MTTRERILIVAMTCAAAWGVSSLGLDHVRKNRADVKAALLQAEIRTFVDQHRALTAPLRLNARERKVLDEAVAAWAGSPFVDRQTLATEVEAPVQKFFYTGFIQAGSQQLAILNGREYRVGEPVAQTDFRVEVIHPDHVVLVSGSGGRRMTVGLQTSNRKRDSK